MCCRPRPPRPSPTGRHMRRVWRRGRAGERASSKSSRNCGKNQGNRGISRPTCRFILPGNPPAMAVREGLLPERYIGPQPVGRGGMGEIYRATDTSLGRAVAIKLLDDRYARDENIRARFTREALAAARLSGNPHIVTIFDVGEWQDRPYIVMEYIGGGSLEERLRADGPVPPRQALEWLEEAANALDA